MPLPRGKKRKNTEEEMDEQTIKKIKWAARKPTKLDLYGQLAWAPRKPSKFELKKIWASRKPTQHDLL
jgi:hypothetical protein